MQESAPNFAIQPSYFEKRQSMVDISQYNLPGKRCVGWHASRVTDRVRVTTGNTMDPDKHWLMHIHTTTLYTGDASTDQPQIQRAPPHLMRIHPHHHHAQARTQIERIPRTQMECEE